MRMDKNNNSKIIYKLAKNNLQSKKLSSIISLVSIITVTSLIMGFILIIIGRQTSEKQILDNMQHVIYMNVTNDQIESISNDEKVDICVPYKQLEKVFEIKGKKYNLNYSDSHSNKINTYIVEMGKEPRKYNEIVIDKNFIELLGEECKLGERISLKIGNKKENFIITGYTNAENENSKHLIRVSKEFADKNSEMKEIPYMALVRLKEDVIDESISNFTSSVYQIAKDYNIDRQNVNLNGKFELSLQNNSAESYTILFISILFFFVSSIVVYSIFYFSVIERVRQIGQFLTIGMTEKQIKKMIYYEGRILSVLGIPVGLVLGGIISYIVFPSGWRFINYIIISLIIGILESLVVQISIRKPALIASKISPIEASKENINLSKGVNNKRHKLLTPYVLAKIEIKGNIKKIALATISLTFGGIMFMLASTWASSWDEDKFSRETIFKNSEYYIGYSYNLHDLPKAYGITELQLKGHLSESLKKEILKIPGVKSIEIKKSGTGIVSYKNANFTQSFSELTEEDKSYFKIPAKGNNSYRYMVENDAILITDKSFSEDINGIKFVPGDKIKFNYFNGEDHTIELEIAAISDESVQSEFTDTNFFMTDKTMKKLWKNMNTSEYFSIAVDNYDKNSLVIEKKIRNIISKYDDLNLQTLREKKIENEPEIKKYKLQIYGVSIFVIVFGIFNLINTVSSSIIHRKKQFSRLESIGMDRKQLIRMLIIEGILLVLPSIILTLVLGTISSYVFINILKTSAIYLEYKFPVISVFIYTIIMLLIPIIITLYCVKIQENIPLVERIKNE